MRCVDQQVKGSYQQQGQVEGSYQQEGEHPKTGKWKPRVRTLHLDGELL